ncbi:MAG: hypothetical protein LBV19_10810 [Streptococcaceae bacterium]|jgi:hypothetical protein|nr:hypothetical protein [Streptococcaceae bacterium]
MKKKILLIFTGLLILFSLGGCNMFNGQGTKGGQIAYLKKHESELTDFVKKQNPKVTSVQYNWDSVEVGTVGNGTPQGGGELLIIFGYVNEKENLDFRMDIPVKNNEIQIDRLGLGQALTDF